MAQVLSRTKGEAACAFNELLTEMNDVEFNTHEMLSSGHFTLNMIELQLTTGN